MKLKIKRGIVFLLSGLSMGGFAQDFQRISHSTVQLSDSLISPLQGDNPPKEKINPAYLNAYGLLVPQAHIETFYQDFKDHKQHQLLKGKAFRAYGLQAYWFTPIDSTANFLGEVRFAKGNQKEVYANTMRLSDDYGPYLLLNKKASDFNFQRYEVRGTYNKSHAKMNWGVQVYYTGDYAYKQTDPRAKAIASWFGLQLGGKYKFSTQHQVGVSSTYELHTQHVELDVWKGNIKQQFLLLRGFGMYDHDHKDQVFSKKRTYNQQQIAVNLMASLWKKNKLTLDFLVDGALKKMKTEEESTINLYQLTTTTLQAQTKVNYSLAPSWRTWIEGAYYAQHLTGQENRYSYQRVNTDYSGVYDYVKIGAIKPYTLEEETWKVAWQWRYTANQRWSYQWGIHYAQTRFDERYKGTTFRTTLEKNKPGLALHLKYSKNKHRLVVGFEFESEKSSKAYAQKDSSYESLYDDVYYPMFVYQSMDKTIGSMALDYSYQLKENQRLGVKVGFSKIEANKTKLKAVESFGIDANLFSIQGYYQF